MTRLEPRAALLVAFCLLAYAATAFARDVLSVKDNLDRALAAVPEELRQDERIKPLLIGIEATGRELDAVFQRNGISSVDDVDEAIGRFALTLLLDGAKAGHYGVKPSAADGVLPPLETAPRSG